MKEIMRHPYILPAGSSVEEQSLRAYFERNGYKDPITRQPLNPNFVFPNLALQQYIREHPRLKLWEKYEYDLLHN
jgi:hypothetical protein